MFEYINGGVLFFIVILIVTYFFESKEKKSWTKTFIVVGLLLLLYEASTQSSAAEDNARLFKKGKALKCRSGGGLYDKADRYRVSLQDGWVLQGDSFIKESLMIRANKCERL